MRRVRNLFLAFGLGALILGAAVPALATNAPRITHDPPTILFEDLEADVSDEDADISRAGKDFRFLNKPVAPFSSDPECEAVPGGLDCRRAGIRKIVVKLGDLGDEVQINLGSVARDVTQILRGQDGGDILRGERGPQIIKGGDGGDTLQGGAGGDLLNGGPGVDNCLGGPGPDTVINCEN